jgi:hypothetical protein
MTGCLFKQSSQTSGHWFIHIHVKLGSDLFHWNMYMVYRPFLRLECELIMYTIYENKSLVWTWWCSLNRFWTQESTPIVVSELCSCNNSKIRQGRVTVLCTGLLINENYLPTKFLVDAYMVSELKFLIYFKMLKLIRAITPKLGKPE